MMFFLICILSYTHITGDIRGQWPGAESGPEGAVGHGPAGII